MLTDRQTDHSVLTHLAALFTAPPSGFTNSFHVYYEDSFHNPLFIPSAPFIWILDKNVRPSKSRLPMLIVRRGPSAWLPFELGNREGQLFTYSLLIFGRNRGEPSDIASFLKKNLDPVPVYNFDVTPALLNYKVPLNNLVSVPNDASGEIGIEGGLAYQENLVFDFDLKELQIKMPTPSNPVDVAHLGHRFQLIVAHADSERELVASRVQNANPSNNYNTEVFQQLGSVDPAGKASESPEFRFSFEENVHGVAMDLLLAGKEDNDTTWNLHDYINNSAITAFLLERSVGGVIIGEKEYSECVISEIQWRWQVGQPITAMYTAEGRLAKHWLAAQAPHDSWGLLDTNAPGGIKAKDARLYLGGTTEGYRVYRIQGMTLRVNLRALVVKELGSRPVVGYIQEPPTSTLDVDFAAADAQPDDYVFTNVGAPVEYYDYVNPVDLGNSAIRIFDPDDDEGETVLRSWLLENLTLVRSDPVRAQVRGLATKRYSFAIHQPNTPDSGGVILFDGDIA